MKRKLFISTLIFLYLEDEFFFLKSYKILKKYKIQLLKKACLTYTLEKLLWSKHSFYIFTETFQQKSNDDRISFEKRQGELQAKHEQQIKDMEADFEKQVKSLRNEYEEKISASKLEQDRSEPPSPSRVRGSPSKQSKSRKKNTENIHFQQDLLYSELEDLRCKLSNEESRSATFHKEISNLKIQLVELENLVSEKEVLINEKNIVISRLETEKIESEKIYKDLLEKEFPCNKANDKEQVSSSSLETSFHSAKEDVHCAPRSLIRGRSGSESEEFSQSANNNSEIDELNKMISSSDNPSNLFTANRNNNNFSESSTENKSCLNYNEEELFVKISQLEADLLAAGQREAELKAQLEEKERVYLNMLEASSIFIKLIFSRFLN